MATLHLSKRNKRPIKRPSKRVRRQVEATRADRWLRATWPDLFNHRAPKPLAIGIRAAILQAAAADPDGPTRRGVYSALARWCRSRAYLQALIQPGAMRHGLDGQPVEAVGRKAQEAAAGELLKRVRR